MAETPSSIFNQHATEKLRSPDDLDKYVRVTTPSVWLLLAACAALLVGLLSWGFFGSISTNIHAVGAYENNGVVCFLSAEDAMEVHVGDSSNVGGIQMEVASISPAPVSREEAVSMVESDYLVDTLMKEDWAFVVTFKGDPSSLTPNVPLDVSITTESVAPISLILQQ